MDQRVSDDRPERAWTDRGRPASSSARADLTDDKHDEHLPRDTIEVRTAPAPSARAPKKDDAPEKDDAADDNAQEDSKKDKGPKNKGDGTDDDADDAEDQPQGRFGILRRHPFLAIGGAVLLVAALVGGTLWYLQARHFENSDDAFVDARQFSVSPRVAGIITEVHITDNTAVKTGDLLFKIDPRDYQIAVEQQDAAVAQAQAQIGNIDAQIESQKAQVEVASAQVEQTDAALVLAKQEEQRALDLVAKGAGTLQNEQQRRSALTQAQADSSRSRANLLAAQRQVSSLVAQRKSAEANAAAASAQLDQARLNLSYTDVKAAQPGTIARLTGAVGQYVQAGQAVTMYVPDRLWVTANFKETQITDMRPGQKVTLHIDAYPNRKIEGHVDSIQPGSGTAFSLLPAENATGNYVKVVQRVPVKIVFDSVPSDVTLGPGMSVVPRVRVR